MKKEASNVEVLYYLAGAFKSAIEGGFFAREHAAAIFKSCLRETGFEIPSKNRQMQEEE